MIASKQYLPFLVLASACAAGLRSAPPVQTLSPLPFAADTLRAQQVRPGVTHWFVYAPSGPWAIHVLDVNRDSCYSAVAVKGADGAAGREKTSALLASLAKSADVVGGVNADFFSPSGMPTNAHVSRGRLLTGPSAQPVLAFDSTGAPRITTLSVDGYVELEGARYDVRGWNRPSANGFTVMDANWGRVTDTASAALEVAFEPGGRVVQVDTALAGIAIPAGGAVLIGRGAAALLTRRAMMALKAGDTLNIARRILPFVPTEAVGGRPVLVRDSAIVGEVDTEGAPGFATGRHPRTAAGIARGGKRLLLVAVDGRQKPYSDGMTLRELANVMLALGARDAINLDGGGSTTLVYADPDSAGALRVANRPSDSTGERPVGNALAIVRQCARAN